jgi:hypothetical protein
VYMANAHFGIDQIDFLFRLHNLADVLLRLRKSLALNFNIDMNQ